MSDFQYLGCRVYSDEVSDSSEDEMEPNNQIGIRSQSLEFFIQHSTKLIEIQVNFLDKVIYVASAETQY